MSKHEKSPQTRPTIPLSISIPLLAAGIVSCLYFSFFPVQRNVHIAQQAKPAAKEEASLIETLSSHHCGPHICEAYLEKTSVHLTIWHSSDPPNNKKIHTFALSQNEPLWEAMRKMKCTQSSLCGIWSLQNDQGQKVITLSKGWARASTIPIE